MALVVYSRTKHHPPAATEASCKYQRLLRMVKESIARADFLTSDASNIDASLLAVFLMGRYESATQRPADLRTQESFTSLRSWSHHDGAMAILKIWNDSLSHNAATQIIKHTRRGLIKSSLLRSLPLPDWMLNGKHFGEANLELEIDRIAVGMINLRYVSANLHRNNGLQNAKAEELNNEARSLDESMENWAAQIPETMSPQRHILTEPDAWPKRHFYSSMVCSYSEPEYAAVWSQYYAASMLINSTRLRILEVCHRNPAVDFDYERQRAECITRLRNMGDSIASALPCCLGRFKAVKPSLANNYVSIVPNPNEEIKPYLANLAAWPLTVASSVGGIDVKQQQWFRSELATLGKILGDGILESAESNQWLIL